MQIIAVDPGGTSGVCELHTEVRSFNRYQLGPQDHHAMLYTRIFECHPEVVVCENWQHRAKLQGGDPAKPKEYIGVIKHYAQVYGAELVLQPASTKTFWTNDKIKALSLWLPNQVHAMDATRHMLQYLTFTLKDQTYLQKLRPERQPSR